MAGTIPVERSKGSALSYSGAYIAVQSRTVQTLTVSDCSAATTSHGCARREPVRGLPAGLARTLPMELPRLMGYHCRPSTLDVGDRMDPNPVVDSEIEKRCSGDLENPAGDAEQDERSVHQPTNLTRAR